MSLFVSSSRAVDAACAGAAAVAAALLTGCNATTPVAPERVMPAPMAVAAPPQQKAPGVPPVIAQSLSQLIGPGANGVEGSIALRELELSPNGPRALMARGEGRLCEAQNCAVGVFEEQSGMLRPVLLAMGSAEPWVHPVSHLGRPDLSLTSIDSDAALRVVRYRWDGANYAEADCVTVDRRRHRASACLRLRPEDVPVLEGSAAQLCTPFQSAIKDMSEDLNAAPVIEDAFLIRRDARAHVQGLRLEAASHDDQLLQPLVTCLKRAGLALKPAKATELPGSLPTMSYFATDHKLGSQKVSVVLTSTTLADKGYSLVSLGVFAR